jgi:hypothetical protein
VATLDLSRLSPATVQLLQDARRRARLTSDLLQSDPSTPASVQARDTIDAGVVEILAAAGLPRGPINGPVTDHQGRGWFGRKLPDCTLIIDTVSFLLSPEADRADSLLKTWIHESIHARNPYAPGFHREWHRACGYEEGLAEGLARLIADELGLRPTPGRYDFYVSAHRTLAAVIAVDLDILLRSLWAYPAGEVSAAFPEVIERILTAGRSTTRLQRAPLVLFSERHFSTARMNDRPDEQTLLRAWRSIVT